MPLLKHAFHQQRGLIIFTLAAFLTALVVALVNGAEPRDLAIQLFGLKMIGMMLLVFFCVLFAAVYATTLFQNFRQGRGLRGVDRCFNDAIAPYLTAHNLAMGFIGLTPLVLINFTVSIGKSLIPVLGVYRWDPLMADWDRVLHFGHYPHEWVLGWIESWHLSGVMNFFYLAWFLLVFISNGYALFCDRDYTRRMRYLWSVAVTWIGLGVVLATIFASVGPVYFNAFYPGLDNPYDALLDHLHAVQQSGIDLNVIQMSPVLLEMVQNDRVLNLNGISAMPSMHVAIAWLITLYAFSVKRWAGMMALFFFIMIQIGSVYLSWHYAIDGYASVILVSIIWWLAGKYLNRARVVNPQGT